MNKKICKHCNGHGFEYTGIDEAPTAPCRYCDGTGKEPEEVGPCEVCGGDCSAANPPVLNCPASGGQQ